MNNPVSFNGANYVARLVGYQMTGGWGQGDRATSEHFQPLETYRARFAEILRDVRALGFRHLDLWSAQLGPTWATDDHIRTAREELEAHGLEVTSLGGWFGSTAAEFETTCRIARGVGCRILAGSTSMLDKDRPFVIETLRAHDLVLGVENHPEATPQALRERIGAGEGVIMATVDTGWFGTQGYDAARALEELADVLACVHLKDVRAAGAHDTCRYGEGVVPIEACVRTLERIGYAGAISVEHEPETFDPTDDVRASRALLLAWMGREAGA
jgi:L-ribulose-5-phosphate 3-epimerase